MASSRIYPLEGDDHQIEIVQTLTDIDERWADHVTPEAPA
jgi:hypothetical protein